MSEPMPSLPSLLRPLVALVALCCIGNIVSIVNAPAAAAQTCGNTSAAPTLTVSPTSIPASATTSVTVNATGYLVPPHNCGSNVFGGVYVFFGWVAPGGQWGPSWRNSSNANGQFGVSYSYPGEGGGGETRDDGSGVVRLVSFTAGGTSGSETPFHMDGAGNWSTTISVRGALYSWTDVSTGARNTVDCRTVQCGILTIGAHGKNSRTNELFAPISFRNEGPPPTVAPGGVTAAPSPAAAGGATSGSSGTKSGGATGSPVGGSKGSGSAGAGSGPASSAPSSTAPASDTTVPTTAPDAVAGEELAAADESAVEREIVAGRVVELQEFEGSGGSGGLATLLIALALLAGAVTATGWFVRRTRGAGAASSTSPPPPPPPPPPVPGFPS